MTYAKMEEVHRGLWSGWDGHFTAKIFAKSLKVGKGTSIHSDIGTSYNVCDEVVIGDNVYIGPGCNIQVPKLFIGDYTKIHRNGLIYGRNPIRIGHNCWFGEGTVLDAEGKTTIGNNVGAGAYSQLWSHIRHGDLMVGCKYYGFSELNVGDDCWFVGHCIVSPVRCGPFSVALVGSVVTRDMEANHVYGGSPAKDLTDKLGEPFQFTQAPARREYMEAKLTDFYDPATHSEDPVLGAIRIVDDWEPAPDHVSQFNVVTRQYTKRGTPLETAFMKFLLPEAKFTPREA